MSFWWVFGVFHGRSACFWFVTGGDRCCLAEGQGPSKEPKEKTKKGFLVDFLGFSWVF